MMNYRIQGKNGSEQKGADNKAAQEVPFCTCSDLSCPFHPTNHDKGCTPCIAKNLKGREIPSCFFNAAGGDKPAGGWKFEDFAELIASMDRGKDL